MDKNNSDNQLIEFGNIDLESLNQKDIFLLPVIGEIEGHENLPSGIKTTKYEHVLPQLAYVESKKSIKGMLIIINTIGGDCSAGLAMAEMVASISKPVVSLVIGDSHSIGVPLAVASDYSYIVPSATMIIHPVRMNGMMIGAPQTFDYIKIIQDRILQFVSDHCDISMIKLEKMMMNTGMLTRDIGTILVGEEAVKEGLINEIGGISQAYQKLNDLIKNQEMA